MASKVHFHLGSYEQAEFFALVAEDLFDTLDDSAYANCILAKCIDSYKELRSSGDPDTALLTKGEKQRRERKERRQAMKKAKKLRKERRKLKRNKGVECPGK